MSSAIDLDLVGKLEALSFRAWPALETRDIGAWRLRLAGGYTKRANSINALGRDARFDADTLGELEAVYRSRGQMPVWRLTPLAPPALEGRLRARGYRQIDQSLVQRCPLDDRFARDPAVVVHPQPTARWIEAFCQHSPVAPEHREVMQRMLRAIAPPVGFALAEHAGHPCALAIGAVEDDHLGLFDVLVMPQARRQGWARRVSATLYAWASGRGARFAYLQVLATNSAALPLYRSQGFRTVYDYRYWLPAPA